MSYNLTFVYIQCKVIFHFYHILRPLPLWQRDGALYGVKHYASSTPEKILFQEMVVTALDFRFALLNNVIIFYHHFN